MADVQISGLAESKSSLAANDVFAIDDSADTNTTKKTTTANIKSYTDSDVVKTVNSVEPTAGAVVLDPDDLDDTLTTNKFTTAEEITKLSGIAPAATANAAADVSEVNTGTDSTKFVTADALAGSYAGTKVASVIVFDATTDVAIGDGKAYLTIPAACNGMNLVRAQATVVTAGTTNATTVMVHNLTDTVDMLSGAISIASAGTVGTVGTVDASHDDVATDDILRIDVDGVSSTAPKGLTVILEFRLA